MPTADRTAAAEERRIVCREHRVLEPLMARLEATAGLVGTLPTVELAGVLRKLIDELEKTLLPHLAWEEGFCYPEIERLAGTASPTRCLRIQHEQLRRSVEGFEADWLRLLEGTDHRMVLAVRAQLHEFHALLSSHLEQEELVLLTFMEAEPRLGSAEEHG